jgi:hypothetical protein
MTSQHGHAGARIDAYRDYGTWLDASIAAAQVAEKADSLTHGPDPLHKDTLRHATSYYAQALALDHELGTAAAVRGLLLLGYSWLMEDKKLYSSTAWKEKNTESQVRRRLDERRINTAIPFAFTSCKLLLSVSTQLRQLERQIATVPAH